MKRSLFCLLILSLSISNLSYGQRYPKRKILKDLKSLPGFENAFIGFKLYDPVKGKVIAEQYADKHMTPASTTKLFTFNAGLQYLPDTLSALEYVVKGDSLIFWSTGYPLTLHPDHPDSTVVKFLTESDKQLFYWPRPMKDERFGPGWGWDDYPAYYGAEKSVFPIYGNSVQFILDNEKKAFTAYPDYKGWQYQIETDTSDRGRVKRDEFWNEFKVSYRQIGELDSIKQDTLIRPFRYSTPLFIDLLSNAVGKSIKPMQRESRPEAFQTLKGARADSLYKWMLQPSDNLFAEQIMLMISGIDNDTLSTKNGIDLAMGFGSMHNARFISKKDMIWRDGSGLSRYNMFTPKRLVKQLDVLRMELGEKRLYKLLPQGATSGSLKDWYGPYVYAKTGTLSNNHSLAGYIKTDSGKTLIFTIMANHYTTSTSIIRSSFGVILEKIKKAY